MSCQHPKVWPDGVCVACGVFATMMPGHSPAHEVVARTPAAEIEAHLKSLGWKPYINYGGEHEYIRADNELCVTVVGGADGWLLGQFTDSDIDGVATGRYRTIDEGETLAELKISLETNR